MPQQGVIEDRVRGSQGRCQRAGCDLRSARHALALPYRLPAGRNYRTEHHPAGFPTPQWFYHYAGRRTVVVEHHGEVCFGKPPQGKDARLGFLPYECRKWQSPVDYGIAIGVGSNFRMQPYVTPGVVHIGEPILLTAVLSEADLPVLGGSVTVKAVSPSGSSWLLPLLNDGAHDDGTANNGEYARQFTQTTEEGSYELRRRHEPRRGTCDPRSSTGKVCSRANHA